MEAVQSFTGTRLPVKHCVASVSCKVPPMVLPFPHSPRQGHRDIPNLPTGSGGLRAAAEELQMSGEEREVDRSFSNLLSQTPCY